MILPVFFLLLIGLVAVYIATANDYPGTIAKVMMQQGIWIF
ncbi:Cell division protein FtsW [Streptococcus sp. HSISB1]|nr:Cell division protein FtsW [Streptococcus sp. HSISB1]